MKALKLLLVTIVASVVVSCSNDDYIYDNPGTPISLETLLSNYELWYVDIHSTTGSGSVPFMELAFTMSYRSGRLYANNNLVGIGSNGSGFGIQVGNYTTYDVYSSTLTINHDIDGVVDFEVRQLNDNEISLYDRYENVTYYLQGYQRSTFDYDQVFYDNIEYFLQEYYGWGKTYRSDGPMHDFDYENYLAFTPENTTTFYSSEDPLGIDIYDVVWDYVGGYEVYDIEGYDNLKYLTFDYDLGYNEEFELVVINDGTIELFHINSGVTYQFEGRDLIIILKEGKQQDVKNSKNVRPPVSNALHKRTKVKRKTVKRESYLK
ncbi:hypothetical protein KH5_09960 [Urechidicola sp. KH5]